MLCGGICTGVSCISMPPGSEDRCKHFKYSSSLNPHHCLRKEELSWSSYHEWEKETEVLAPRRPWEGRFGWKASRHPGPWAMHVSTALGNGTPSEGGVAQIGLLQGAAKRWVWGISTESGMGVPCQPTPPGYPGGCHSTLTLSFWCQASTFFHWKQTR